VKEVFSFPLSPLRRNPLVSVVITSYNYADFIRDALNSVLAQEYNNLEIVVADDGSTDGSQKLIRQYERDDSRVHLVEGDNLGQPANTNRGFAATTGEIVCFLDADDRFRRGKVEAIVEAFLAHPGSGLCMHPLQKIDQFGRRFGRSFPKFIDSGWLHNRLLANGGRCGFPPTSAISIRREVAQAVFPIQSNSRRVGDAYIHYPAAFLTNVCNVSAVLGEYRCHDRSMTWASRSKAQQSSAFLLEYEEVFSTNQQFVARQFGSVEAAMLRLIDSQEYLEHVLKYIVLGELDGYSRRSPQDYIAMIRDRRQKAKWTLLMTLPKPVSQQVLLWGATALKAFRKAHAKSQRKRIDRS
jgi:glycosyltransferase involved in cell wall biosynthesis